MFDGDYFLDKDKTGMSSERKVNWCLLDRCLLDANWNRYPFSESNNDATEDSKALRAESRRSRC